MPGPLAGIRVVDASAILSGPMATMILADQGADVIKVEAPGVGDPMRQWGRTDGKSLWWPVVGRNKRTVTLNLREEEGQELFLQLVAKSDIIVENFRAGTFEKWNLSYERLREVNPGIILVRVMGFAGLALSTSVAVIVNATLQIVMLRRALGGIEAGRIAVTFVKTTVAALAMAATAWYAQSWLNAMMPGAGTAMQAVRVFGAIAAGIAVLSAAAWMLRRRSPSGLKRKPVIALGVTSIDARGSRSSTSQMRMTPSAAATASCSPSTSKATLVTADPSPSRMAMRSARAGSHSSVWPSSAPKASSVPSGLRTTAWVKPASGLSMR